METLGMDTWMIYVINRHDITLKGIIERFQQSLRS